MEKSQIRGERVPSRGTSVWRQLPGGVVSLGLVSLCMDTSSELVHSLLPVFMSSVLGASMTTIGLVEGVAEATAAITKVFSGTLSDLVGKRKVLVVAGYGLATLTKPVFAMARSVGWVFAARFTDRVGKGIRVAPRDALVADLTPAHLRGAAYGLRQALDSVGAVLGPGLALALMLALGSIRSAMWFSVLPALVAVSLLLLAVREPPQIARSRGGAHAWWRGVGQLGRRFWLVVALGVVFTLARFSEAFLVLRGRSAGLSLALVPLVMIVMNTVYAAVAFPAGAASDRHGARALLLWGLGVLVAADLVLAWAATPGAVLAGAALWGLHMALTQGLLSKLVADTAPAHLRGTAFGFFNLASGVALLAASTLAGFLWARLGPPATFLAGAFFATVAAAGVATVPRPKGGMPQSAPQEPGT